MRTESSHLRALRAAAQVARTVRRTVQWPLVALLVPACGQDTAAGATPADAQGLFDAILGAAAGDPGASQDAAGASDDAAGASDGSDGAATLDVAEASDGSDGPSDGADGAGVEDVAGGDAVDLADIAGLTDTDGPLDVAMVDAQHPDATVPTDLVELADAPFAGDVDLPDTCTMPNGVPCTTVDDCTAAAKVSNVCVDGVCNDQDFSSEAAMACCQAQYAAGNFAVPGCNPWGPPAPPEDRSYRLPRDVA